MLHEVITTTLVQTIVERSKRVKSTINKLELMNLGGHLQTGVLTQTKALTLNRLHLASRQVRRSWSYHLPNNNLRQHSQILLLMKKIPKSIQKNPPIKELRQTTNALRACLRIEDRIWISKNWQSKQGVFCRRKLKQKKIKKKRTSFGNKKPLVTVLFIVQTLIPKNIIIIRFLPGLKTVELSKKQHSWK